MSPILRLRRRLRNFACLFAALGLLFIRTRHHCASFIYTVPQSPALTAALFFLVLWRNPWRKTNASALPPRVKGWLPGNIDILWQLVKGESNEYCASTLHRWEQTYGPTYDMNILWSHQACLFLLRYAPDAAPKAMLLSSCIDCNFGSGQHRRAPGDKI